MRPFIAITAGEILRSGDEWAPIVQGQSHTYPDAVTHAGGVPFIIPIVDDDEALRQLYEQCRGLLFSGGSDVDPALNGGSLIDSSGKSLPKRDKQELRLLRWALEDDKPILGICRGMQLINVVLGGSLHRDIPANLPNAHNHEKSVDHKDMNHLAHRLQIQDGSRLAEIIGQLQIGTNTLHHQAINELGHGLVATAHAEDGVVEAIELPGKRFVVGIQSHPEALEAVTEPLWRGLFKAFVKACSVSKR